MTRKTKRLILIATIIVVVGGVGFAFYSMDTKYKQEIALTQKNCQAQISSLQNELDSKKVQVYVPINDIKAGQVISPDMLEETTIFSDSDPSVFLDIESLTMENTEAVENLTKFLAGEHEQDYTSDELYDEYTDYISEEGLSMEDAGSNSVETTAENTAEEVGEISVENREENTTHSSIEEAEVIENTDVPAESLEVSDETATSEETEELIESVSSSSDEIQELTGVIAVTDLLAGQPIYKSSIQIMDCGDLREKYINFVTLNTNLEEGDTVDIRIKFPNGEDYVILSKDVLRDLNLAGAEFYLWIDEESILRLSAATVDAAINGGEIYVTKYVKPSIQDALVYTYQPSEDVLRLIQWDPNIVLDAENTYSNTKRGEFEARLKAFNSRNSEEDSVSSDVSTTTTN